MLPRHFHHKTPHDTTRDRAAALTAWVSRRVVCSYVRYVNAAVAGCEDASGGDRMIERQPEPARFDIHVRYPVMIPAEEAGDEDAEVTFTTTEGDSYADRGEDSDASEVCVKRALYTACTVSTEAYRTAEEAREGGREGGR